MNIWACRITWYVLRLEFKLVDDSRRRKGCVIILSSWEIVENQLVSYQWIDFVHLVEWNFLDSKGRKDACSLPFFYKRLLKLSYILFSASNWWSNKEIAFWDQHSYISHQRGKACGKKTIFYCFIWVVSTLHCLPPKSSTPIAHHMFWNIKPSTLVFFFGWMQLWVVVFVGINQCGSHYPPC